MGLAEVNAGPLIMGDGDGCKRITNLARNRCVNDSIAFGRHQEPFVNPPTASTVETGTALPAELKKFAAIADQWWDPDGEFKPLHALNPIRLQFIRDAVAFEFGRPVAGGDTFKGLRLLDIGCGGGLIAEPMTRLGFAVTGIDAEPKNINTARAHAIMSGLEIDYRASTPERLLAAGEPPFDAVVASEVIEHVADIDRFLAAATGLLRPGGVFVGTTINRTLPSLLLAKIAAEYVLRWVARGTHDWRKFVKPSQFADGLVENGLSVTRLSGMRFDPLSGDWRLTRDVSINYLIAAAKR